MAYEKVFNGKVYKLIKQTPNKGEAKATKSAYSRDYNVRMEKVGRVWYVWARRK